MSDMPGLTSPWQTSLTVMTCQWYLSELTDFHLRTLMAPSPTSAVDLITATGEQMKLKINKDFKTQSESIGEGRGTLISKIKKDISALFSIDSAEFQKGKSPKTNVTVVFFDKDPGYLTISYDSSEKSDKGSKHPEKYYKLAGKIKMSGTKTWKYAKFSVEDAFFGKRLSGADLKVATTNSDIILSGVFLDKAQ